MSDVAPHDTIRAIRWEDGALLLLDQRKLPQRQEYLQLTDAPGVARAIQEMVVRGAPAIGIAAAYGVVLAARDCYARAPHDWKRLIDEDLAVLGAARPTAVNLTWALKRMRGRVAALSGDPAPTLEAEAAAIHAEDVAANRALGELGAGLIDRPCAVLTHCNTGALATGGHGTALGVIRSAHAQGKILRVYAGETRPWLQGARLTAWELLQEDIPVSVIVDGAAAALMAQARVGWVIVGADRITANGDVVNKIGTYALAVAARHHGIGFMVAAPRATVDLALDAGDDVPIEIRDPREVLACGGHPVAAPGAEAWNPVFDVTPAVLIDAIVTERGLVRAPDRKKVEKMMSG